MPIKNLVFHLKLQIQKRTVELGVFLEMLVIVILLLSLDKVEMVQVKLPLDQMVEYNNSDFTGAVYTRTSSTASGGRGLSFRLSGNTFAVRR